MATMTQEQLIARKFDRTLWDTLPYRVMTGHQCYMMNDHTRSSTLREAREVAREIERDQRNSYDPCDVIILDANDQQR